MLLRLAGWGEASGSWPWDSAARSLSGLQARSAAVEALPAVDNVIREVEVDVVRLLRMAI